MNFPSEPSTPARPESTILDFFRTALRHKLLIAFVTLFTVGVFGAYSLTFEPVFQAEARVLLEDSSADTGVIGQLALLSQNAPPATREIQVIRSRKIADAVVAQPDSQTVPEFGAGLGLGLTQVVDDLDRHKPSLVFWRKLFKSEPPVGHLEVEVVTTSRSPNRPPIYIKFLSDTEVELTRGGLMNRQTKVFSYEPGKVLDFHNEKLLLHTTGGMTGRQFRVYWRTARSAADKILTDLSIVETQRGSGVLLLRFRDNDPDRAAEILNAIARVYIGYNRDRLTRRAGKTVEFIGQEMERVKEELLGAEKELVEFSEESGGAMLTDLGVAILERITAIDIERAKLKLQISSQERLANFANDPNSMIQDVLAAVDMDPLTMSLADALAESVAEADAMAEEWTEEWQGLVNLRKRIARLRASLRNNILSRAEALKQQDETLAEALDEHQAKLAVLPRTERELATFQRRALSLEGIYTMLLTNLQEAKIAKAASLEQVDVLEWALPPTQRIQPILTYNLALALAVGMVIGLGLAFFRESYRRTILSAAQLETATGLPQFGVVPDFRRGAAKSKSTRGRDFLALIDDPTSATAEAYRGLRANLKFAAKGSEVQTLAITSAGQGEGKSTTTADLCIALAQGGATTLLVDADLRRPVIHKFFKGPIKPGLSEVLSGDAKWQDSVQQASVANLKWLPAGSSSLNPGDLLASSLMAGLVNEMKAEFDYVLFDVPPVLAVADASSFLNELDAILLLCRANHVPEGMVVSATRRLRMVGAPVIGSILNGFRPSRMQGDYSHYGYGYGYGYGSGYGNRDKQTDAARDSTD